MIFDMTMEYKQTKNFPKYNQLLMSLQNILLKGECLLIIHFISRLKLNIFIHAQHFPTNKSAADNFCKNLDKIWKI